LTFITFLSKWLHIISIIGVLGTAICLRYAVIPALKEADPETGNRLFRYAGRLMAGLWALILLTGFFNLYRVSADVNKGYHMALGGKIALAFIMLAISTIASHPSPRFAGAQQKRAQWLTAAVILGLVIVGISSHLNISRITGTGLEKQQAAPAVTVSR
jgi:hypothetical protein